MCPLTIRSQNVVAFNTHSLYVQSDTYAQSLALTLRRPMSERYFRHRPGTQIVFLSASVCAVREQAAICMHTCLHVCVSVPPGISSESQSVNGAINGCERL